MILIVDDDSEFVREASLALHRIDGICSAPDASHAMRLLRAMHDQVGVVLVDLDLPGVSGFDLIYDLRQAAPGLPVIAISGVFSTDVLESAKVLGAKKALHKPVTPAWNSVVEELRRREPPVEDGIDTSSRSISHRRGTGHFRCVCGLKLTFAGDSTKNRQISSIHRDEQHKRGVCPACGVIHLVNLR
jgi:DNA-binding NtrC family response regulator